MSDAPRNEPGPPHSAATAELPPRAYSQDVRSIAIQTPLGKDVLLLRALHGEDGLSRLFRFDLDLLCEQPSIDVSAAIGKPATIGIRLADGTDRFINGIVSRIALTGSEGRFTTYQAELVPWLWLLTRTSDCRAFQNLSVVAIVEKVLTGAGFLDFSNRTQSVFPSREYTVQYRETDFNFISRLMEQFGIFYFFEHENGKHTLVFADAAAEHRPCPGLAQARFRALAATDYEPDVITAWAVAHEVRPAKYSLGSYNFEAPNASLLVNVESVHATESTAKYEVYDYTADYQRRDEGEKLVGLRIEEQEAQAVTIHGSSTCRALASGCRFDLVEHPVNALNQGYVLTAVAHSASEPSYLSKKDKESASGRYRNTFTAIPLSTPFRPRRVTPRPVIHGVQTAVVVGKSGEELWVDKYGRVKVQFHWDREGNYDENSSCWIRVSQNWAGKRWGAMFLPRIGQEVLVEFVDGDPDRPIITGRVYNAEQAPPYDLPAEQTKSALKSNSSKSGGGFNELRFEDKKGAEQLFIHGQRDLDQVIERESRELVGVDRHLIVTKGRFEQVGAEQHLKVGADSVEQVDGARYLAAAKGLHVKAGGRIVLETDGELTIKTPGGFIMLGAAGITIQGTVVNINSGGTAGGAATKAVKLPNRASSSGAGESGGITGEGAQQEVDPDLARVELYRKTYDENSAKMSDADKKAYQQALAELQDATARHDAAGIAAAKAKLDAILTKNNIPIPADPATGGIVPVTSAVQGGPGVAAGPGQARLFAGSVRVEGRRFKTPDGLTFRPVFATAFRLVEQVAHGKQADAVRFLDWARQTGFNGVRVLAMCNGMFKLAPGEGVAALPTLLGLARERGLYAEVVALADTAQVSVDLRAHVSAVAAAIAPPGNALLQVANEHYHGTQDSRLHDVSYLDGLASAVPAGLTYTLSAPSNDEALEPQGMYVTRHLERDAKRDKWNHVRRVREIEGVSGSTRKPAWNDEPIGANEVENPGRRMADPDFFFTMGILNRVFEVGGTFHFEAGLHAAVPGPVQQRCAEAFVSGSTLIPNDADLQFKNATWADSPVKGAAFDTRVVRVYSGVAGNRGWTVSVGKTGDPAIEWQNGWRPVATVVDRGPVAVIEIARG